MRKIGVRIETFVGAGHYQHKIYDVGITAKNRAEYSVPEEVVEALKRANESAWEAMPEGSKSLVASVSYKIPTKH